MARPRIGLALGGGSARGWSHIGIIESLQEAGIEPDIVCGTSIGSLVGAAYVAGRLTELREWAEVVGWREIIGQLDPRLLRGGLIEGKQIIGFLRGLGVAGQIEDFAKPYAAIASDLNTGEEVRLTSGPIECVGGPRRAKGSESSMIVIARTVSVIACPALCVSTHMTHLLGQRGVIYAG